MLNRQMVIDHLCAYEEDEVIYRNYYELRDDSSAQKAFVDSLDPALVVSHNILIPNYPGTFFPSELTEETMFSNPQSLITRQHLQHPGNVFILKHLRYTPALPHSHNYFEIIYMFRGGCHQTLEGENLPLQEGDVCFIPPYHKHTLEIFDDSIALNIILRRSTFEQVFFRVLGKNSVLSDFFISSLFSSHPMKRLVFHTGDDIEIQDAVLEMYLEYTNSDAYSAALLENMIPIFFARILRRYSKTASILKPDKGSNPHALQLLQYIRTNYRDVTLASLADHFHYSASHCSRLIREETGIGFSEMVRHIRCEEAGIFLGSTSDSIAHIAETIGYESPETFIRAFEKEFRMTPTEYRRRNGVS